MVFSTYLECEIVQINLHNCILNRENKRKMDQEELKNMTTLGRWT